MSGEKSKKIVLVEKWQNCQKQSDLDRSWVVAAPFGSPRLGLGSENSAIFLVGRAGKERQKGKVGRGEEGKGRTFWGLDGAPSKSPKNGWLICLPK